MIKSRISYIVILILFFMVCAIGQPGADSFHRRLPFEKADTSNVIFLNKLAEYYQSSKPDSSLLFAQQAFKIAKAAKYLKGEARALDLIASAFNIVGNYPKALEFYIKSLQVEEQRDNPANLAIALMNIGTVYLHQGDYRQALTYTFSANSVIKNSKVNYLRKFALLNIGDIYEKYNKLDSAILYSKEAYTLARAENDENMTGTALNNLANVGYRQGRYQFALSKYCEALPLLVATRDEDFVCETMIGLAKTYNIIGCPDSAVYYASQSYQLADKDGFLKRKLESSRFLQVFYVEQNNIDSAYKYQGALMVAKDSLNSIKRVKEAQLLTLSEQQRQRDLVAQKEKDAHDLKQRLQYIGIGVLIPLIFLATMYLRKKRIKPRIIEFLGLLSVLMFFEYITLLLHPIVLNITHHVPLFELIVFSMIAALLTRMHHNVEHWFLSKINRKGAQPNH